MHGAGDMSARSRTLRLTHLRGLVHALHAFLRRRWLARAAAAREALYDGERSLRERYFAAASDAADLERRQRGWERAAPHAWP